MIDTPVPPPATPVDVSLNSLLLAQLSPNSRLAGSSQVKRCGVCQHSQREVIEAAMDAGDVPSVIAQGYGLRVLDVLSHKKCRQPAHGATVKPTSGARGNRAAIL
jgi:hypothetical protein